MIKSTKAFAILMFLLLVLSVFAQDKTPPEAYSGVAMGTGGTVGGKTIQFDFRITQYTTDQEVENFAQLVKEKGTDALRRALEKEDKGRIAVVGSTGNQIAVARKRQEGSNTIITIVTARTMPFMELYNNGRTTDYPFGYLQVKLDANGQGTGQIMAAARIRFDKKKGEYQIESFGNQYIKATNVRPSK
jgi:outer membrane lipoprotein-sorting protein